ncbi:MAG: synthase [Herbinix sp.]|jgi:CTP synthase (UTP-ammonia lyase)|nr:synthase [Herbinix sp.]
MNSVTNIGIIGDYDGRPSHIATEEAIKHSASKLGLTVETKWLSTDSLEDEAGQKLSNFDGLWCAPGSPYKSMLGAINAIRFARENNYPFIGTCGGFQHAVIEYARNVLQIKDIKDDFDPYSPNLFIAALSCSLVGQTRQITIAKDSKIYDVYGSSEIEEKYNCNFGLDKGFQITLNENGFKVIGTDEDGEARIMYLEQNDFYVATLFQPQLSSTYETPHPLISEYLSYAKNHNRNK